MFAKDFKAHFIRQAAITWETGFSANTLHYL